MRRTDGRRIDPLATCREVEGCEWVCWLIRMPRAASASAAASAATTAAAAAAAAAALPATAPLRWRQSANTARFVLGAGWQKQVRQLHHQRGQQPLPQRPRAGAVLLVHVRHEDGCELRVELELGPARQKSPVR